MNITGTKIPTSEGNYIKIMAVADGYVMARNNGCIPFCESIERFIARLQQVAKSEHVIIEKLKIQLGVNKPLKFVDAEVQEVYDKLKMERFKKAAAILSLENPFKTINVKARVVKISKIKPSKE